MGVWRLGGGGWHAMEESCEDGQKCRVFSLYLTHWHSERPKQA